MIVCLLLGAILVVAYKFGAVWLWRELDSVFLDDASIDASLDKFLGRTKVIMEVTNVQSRTESQS